MSRTITLPVDLDGLELAEGVRLCVEIRLDPETDGTEGYRVLVGGARGDEIALPLSDRCLDELAEIAVVEWQEGDARHSFDEARDDEACG